MNDSVPPPAGSQPPPPPPPPPSEPIVNAPTPPGRETNADAKLYAMLAHLLALTGMVTGGVGFIVGPLIIWLIKREQYPFVDDQGKEAVNFQITMLIIGVGLGILTVVTCMFAAVITLPLLLVVGVIDIVFPIIAGIKANEGVRYRYPLCWRLIK